jgi:hypothetical protein
MSKNKPSEYIYTGNGAFDRKESKNADNPINYYAYFSLKANSNTTTTPWSRE